jgi:hypothetical protein
MRLKINDCDLNLIRGISKDDDLKNESPSRARRIKRRRTKIAVAESEF